MLQKLLKIMNFKLLVVSLLFIGTAFFGLAFIFDLTFPIAYGATANAWNLEKVTGNNLNVSYSTGGISALYLTPGGNVGIGTAGPTTKLNVSTAASLDGLRIDGTNGMTSLLANLGTSTYNGISQAGDRGVIYSANSGFIIAPWAAATSGLRVDANGNTTMNGIVAVKGGTLAGSNTNLSPGALNIGDYGRNYGGGQGWNGNVAGLFLEAADNTEIAVHDAGTRLASLMYFEGAGTNRITIGRNMGWGAISTIALNGNVGIGTGAPNAALHAISPNIAVAGQSANSYAGWFYSSNNTNTMYVRSDNPNGGWTTQIDRFADNNNGGGMLLLTDNGAQSNPNNYFIYTISDANKVGGGDVEFYVRGDGGVWADGAFTPSGADLAEWTPTRYAKELEAGDLVMVDGTAPDALTKKSDGVPYSSKLMGIISTDPGFISGGGEAESKHGELDVMVTLSGRVPTKVSTENGPINPGDFLTSSSTPGVAMKATKSGMVVGKALESFNGMETGKILVWVQALWYGGDDYLQKKQEDQQQAINRLEEELNELKKKLK